MDPGVEEKNSVGGARRREGFSREVSFGVKGIFPERGGEGLTLKATVNCDKLSAGHWWDQVWTSER